MEPTSSASSPTYSSTSPILRRCSARSRARAAPSWWRCRSRQNISAKRASKREHADEVGHLQRLSRADAREIVARAGLRIACELEDPLPLAVHRFLAPDTSSARAKATAKWAVRAGLHRLAPPLARRLYTVHYACLCLPDADIRAGPGIR